MTKSVVLFGLLGLAAAGPSILVPSPFRWDESFTVKQPQLDDEHRGLFNALLRIERDNTLENLNAAATKFIDHFNQEESMFEQTMPDSYVANHKGNHAKFLARSTGWTAPVPDSEILWGKNWLVAHIKNTDFGYVGPGMLPHEVPEPYNWDESFEVFYESLDEEHKILFDSIREVGHNPDSTQALTDLKFNLRAHFDHETGLFCKSKTYPHCLTHKNKHNSFYKVIYAAKNPVSSATVDWAKNWLVQHIKNSDFQYKFELNNYNHEIPRPYVWNPSFKVYSKQLDEEHTGLFDAIRDSMGHPDDASKYDFLKKVIKDHFENEESAFKKIPNFVEYSNDHIAKHAALVDALDGHSVPLDCDFIKYAETWLVQHIKNTDFAYRGKLVHPTPDPFFWDDSFMVFYRSLDVEHQGLFDCVRAVAETPGDATVVANCKTKLRMHFDHEEEEFCKVPDYDCYGHYLKHYNFQTKFQAAPMPVPAYVVTFAKEWLTTHIKNTDHAYRGKLFLRRHYAVPDPFVWDKSFLVDIKQLDDEHTGLFDAVRAVENDRANQATWNNALQVFSEHFLNEEDMFSVIPDNQHDIADHTLRHLSLINTIKGALVPITNEITEFAKNWLTQHIKNTDFNYKGKMPKIYAVPDPFKWDSSFAVNFPDMDVEHKGLFDCIGNIKYDKTEEALANCLATVEHHFAHEESLFTKSGTYSDAEQYQHINKHNALLSVMKSVTAPADDGFIAFATNWLTQHIKNSDFGYKSKMPFPIPDPLAWDESFQVNYEVLDEQHKILFELLGQLKQHPDDVDVLNNNRDWFRDHFDREEKEFMACGELCGADAHKRKHDVFFKTVTWITVPVSQEYIEFAANWLVQHIKNTDFKYKSKLPTQHKTPQPFIWNKEFEVFYKQLDDEHTGLFDGIRTLGINNDASHLEDLKDLLRIHFYNEEAMFCAASNLPWDYCKQHKKKHVQFSEKIAKFSAPLSNDELYFAMDWLVQHIKNTDFAYKGNLKHHIPEPYIWDTSFATDYMRMDGEHAVLFESILAVSQHPEDSTKLQVLKDNIKQHFLYEEGHFCSMETFNCVDHRMKHYSFWVLLEDQKAPINCDTINWAKNWLTQHIKNTDHQYKERLVLNGKETGILTFGPADYPTVTA